MSQTEARLLQTASDALLRRARVLVVDDDPQVLHMIARILGRFPDIEVAGMVTSGVDAPDAVSLYDADIVLMDARMPEVPGAAATRMVLEKVPTARVIALTGAADEETIVEMIEAGAAGYVLKTATPSEIHRAILSVMRGHSALSPQVTGVVLRDLSELYRAEKQRADSLAELDEMKTRFIDTVSHELRTPLTVIEGGIKTLRARGARLDDETTDSLLQSVEQASEHLDRMIRQILAISAMRREARDDAEVADLEEVVAMAVARSPDAQERIDIWVGSATLAISSAVLADIIQSVLDNALSLTTGRVSIRARAGDQMAVIDISDEGPGMQPELIELVLERPFTQGEQGMTRRHDGLGLSLYVARRLLTSYGSDLTIVSAPGSGTTVSISVPCLRPAGSEVARDRSLEDEHA